MEELQPKIEKERDALSQMGMYTSPDLEKMESQYDQAQSIVYNHIQDMKEIVGEDAEYISNPISQEDFNWNNTLDYIAENEDFLLKQEDQSLKNVVDSVSERYKKEADAISEYIKNEGSITEEKIRELAPHIFDELANTFKWEPENIERYFNEAFQDISESGKKYTSTLDELMQENYLATDSYKELSSAIAEQDKNGHISLETYDKLMTTDENLAKYLVLTADGYALNTEALNEYIDTQTKSQKLDAEEAIVEKTKKLDELKEKYDELVASNASSEEIFANLQEQEGIQNEIDALSAYIRELDGATSALERYRAAKKTANGDEDYNEGTNAYKDIQEGLKTGKAYTDDVQSAVDFMLGVDWGTR